jgi:hypothetical protein
MQAARLKIRCEEELEPIAIRHRAALVLRRVHSFEQRGRGKPLCQRGAGGDPDVVTAHPARPIRRQVSREPIAGQGDGVIAGRGVESGERRHRPERTRGITGVRHLIAATAVVGAILTSANLRATGLPLRACVPGSGAVLTRAALRCTALALHAWAAAVLTRAAPPLARRRRREPSPIRTPGRKPPARQTPARLRSRTPATTTISTRDWWLGHSPSPCPR